MAHIKESGILTADKLVHTGECRVYSITIAYTGMTAGERITLIDGTTVAGHDEVPFIVPAANGTITKEWPQGKLFETGVFFNKGATLGSVFAELSWG
jgi:hypothetical protein